MRALCCVEPGHLELIEVARPEPPTGWARVAIAHVGICGTDYHIYEGTHPYLAYPRVIGHELSGRVIDPGDSGLKAGDPVVINPYLNCGHCEACRHGTPNCCESLKVLGVHTEGGMTEEIVVPPGNLYRADGLDLTDAAMVEFLAIGAHAVRRSQIEAGERVLVIGGGPIGLGTAIFARIAGLDVSLLDMSSERLGFAEKELGFAPLDTSKAAADELVRQATGGEGFDLVFDATGNTASVQSAFAHVAHGGTLVLVSVVKDDITFSDPEFHKRETTLIASRNALASDFERVMAAMKDGLVPTAALHSHSFPAEETPTRLPELIDDADHVLKAIAYF